jgi:ribosomal protein L7/L12
MSSEISEGQWSAIKESLYRGDKIGAIKLYREASGMGLKESKDSIEALEKELRVSTPEMFKSSAASSGKGCFGAVLLCAAAVVAYFNLLY